MVLRLEMTSLTSYLRLLFRVFGETISDRSKMAEKQLFPVCSEKLSEYLRNSPPVSPSPLTSVSPSSSSINTKPLTKSQQRRHAAMNQGLLEKENQERKKRRKKRKLKEKMTERVMNTNENKSQIVIVQILQGLLEMPQEKLNAHIKDFYLILTDLVLTESVDIRNVLRGLFVRIGKMSKILE